MQIEDIMKKVLEEIRKMESAKEDREKMLVIGEAQRFEKELRDRYGAHYELEFDTCFDEDVQFDVLLLAQISPNTLQKLAMGMNPRVGPVMEALMSGKEVLYLSEGLLHREMAKTCPKMLYRLYEDSVKKITSFGIRPSETRNPRRGETAAAGAARKRGLIGEKEILKMVESGERILFTEGTPIITPLAKDLMRNHGITLEKRERRE